MRKISKIARDPSVTAERGTAAWQEELVNHICDQTLRSLWPLCDRKFRSEFSAAMVECLNHFTTSWLSKDKVQQRTLRTHIVLHSSPPVYEDGRFWLTKCSSPWHFSAAFLLRCNSLMWILCWARVVGIALLRCWHLVCDHD